MSTEIWILLVLVAAAASALIGFFLARRGAPTRKQLQDLETELETARSNAKQVEGRVSEHFERSAVLFGQLAKDYKAFLDHYSDSAQALGLSEGRARELLEQGYQPLLTHLEQDAVNQPETPPDSDATVAATGPELEPGQGEEDASQAEPPLIEDVVDGPRPAVAKPEGETEPESGKDRAAVRGVEDSTRSARVVAVDLNSKSAGDREADRQSGQG